MFNAVCAKLRPSCIPYGAVMIYGVGPSSCIKVCHVVPSKSGNSPVCEANSTSSWTGTSDAT